MDTRLAALRALAAQDAEVRRQFMDTRRAEDPLRAFSDLAGRLGHPVSAEELSSLGEESCAAMLRSQNGGGEIEPMGWSDDYELFFLLLEAK